MNGKRTVFRWTVQQGVDLLREVVANRPETTAEWLAIANHLMAHWELTSEKHLTARAVREHTELLLQKYKENDRMDSRFLPYEA